MKTTELIKRFNVLMAIGDKTDDDWKELYAIKGEVARRNFLHFTIAVALTVGILGGLALFSALGIRP